MARLCLCCTYNLDMAKAAYKRGKENINLERFATMRFFLLMFVAVSQASLRYTMGVKYDNYSYIKSSHG